MKQLRLKRIYLITATFLMAATGMSAFDYIQSPLWKGVFAPESPNVAEMSTYGSHEPVMHQGRVNLSIPIYEWADNLFNLPITLDYASAGFRPGIESGQVGMGWNLNIGGVITRETRGVPDETMGNEFEFKWANQPSHYSVQGMDYPYITPDMIYNANRIMDSRLVDGYAQIYGGKQLAVGTQRYDYVFSGSLGEEYKLCYRYQNPQSSNQRAETEPDVFHFNVCGLSGSFILQPNHTVKFLSSNAPSGTLSVEFFFNELNAYGIGSYFVITDGLGMKYEFKEREYTSSVVPDPSAPNDDPGIISAWKLTKIIHPSEKEVTFTYGKTTLEYNNVSTAIVVDHLKFGRDIAAPGVWEDPDYELKCPTFRKCLNTVQASGLTGINIEDRGFIAIDWDGDRIEKLTVTNSNGHTLKECTLNYFDNPSVTNDFPSDPDIYFLSSVTLSGTGTYSFSYESQNERKTINYFACDWYGFQNATDIRYIYTNIHDMLSPELAESLENRRPSDFNLTKFGMLRTVTYPTGGSSEYEYEQNTYSLKGNISSLAGNEVPTAGLRVSAVTDYDENDNRVRRTEYSYRTAEGRSSGRLLNWPRIYSSYSIESSNGELYYTRECISTLSSLGYSREYHIEYSRVLQNIYGRNSSERLSSTEYLFNSCLDASFLNEQITNASDELPTDSDGWQMYINGSSAIRDDVQFYGSNPLAGTLSCKNELSINGGPSSSQAITYGKAGISNITTSSMMIGLGSNHHAVRSYISYDMYPASTQNSKTENGSTMTTETETTVDSSGRVATSSTTDSFGNTLVTEYEYHSVVPGLLTWETVTREEKAVSSTQYIFQRKSGNWYVPAQLKEAKIEDYGDITGWRTKFTFGEYDSWGNPRKVTDAAGRQTDLDWGYDGLHLRSSSLTSDGHTLANEWDWEPMVGPTAATDPSGRTTGYTYDSCGRLSSVTDPTNTLAAEYDYFIASVGNGAPGNCKNAIFTTTYGRYTDIMYYDGLGRQLQAVMQRAAGGKDLITPVCVDAFGRDEGTQLPYKGSGNSGLFDSSWEYHQRSYYTGLGFNHGNYLSSPNRYEAAKEGRVTSTGTPGREYVGKNTVYEYSFNPANRIRDYRCESSNVLSYDGGYYAPGTLEATEITNADGQTSIEWKDKEGRVVAQETILEGGSAAVTNYVYDHRGQLAWVLSPQASAAMTSSGTYFDTDTICDRYCYIYTYDRLGRMTQKKLPGKEAEFFVYDNADRVVMSQDGVMRESNRWTYAVYDDFGDMVRKDLVTTSLPRHALQSYFPDAGTSVLPESLYELVANLEQYRYDRSGQPSDRLMQIGAHDTVLVPNLCLRVDVANIIGWGAGTASDWNVCGVDYINANDLVNELFFAGSAGAYKYYYIPQGLLDAVYNLQDNDPSEAYIVVNRPSSIPMGGSPAIPSSLAFEETTRDDSMYYYSISATDLGPSKHMKVYEKLITLPEAQAAEQDYVERAYYYDKMGRVAQTVERNHLGGISRYSFYYDRLGNVEFSREEHSIEGRNGTDIKDVICTYDARGRLIEEDTFINGKQATVDYNYDDLGRVSTTYCGVEDESMEIQQQSYSLQGWDLHNCATYINEGQSNPLFLEHLCYDSPVYGSSRSYAGKVSEVVWSDFGNDRKAFSFIYDRAGRLLANQYYENNEQQQRFTETVGGYDLNGNIQEIQRLGTDGLDNRFAYSYDGNQLASVNGTTYSYDSNGNMTHDGRRGLDVEYNLLNLPSEVENQADDMTARYTYLADATKLEVVDNDGWGYDYLGSLVYRKNDDDSYTLESTAFSGGRIVRNSSGSYRINGFVTDHLGSIRTVYDVETGDIIERNDYYPFGKRLNNSLAMSPTNRYRFSGKEEQVVANVNLLDFGARMYDDEICRWTTVDPLAEKYYSMTPYNYCANNPVMFVDPEGEDIWEIDDEGRIVNRITDKTQDSFYMVAKDENGEYQRTYTTDEDGNKVYDSISFEYGTIESQRSIGFKQPTGENDEYDVYQVRGDKNGTELFEFLAKGVVSKGVEVSQIKCGIEGEKGLNFVTTSHTLPRFEFKADKLVYKSSEKGMPLLYNGQLCNGYTIREMIHSHPYSNKASDSDRLMAKSVIDNSKIFKTNEPVFKIWHVKTQGYKDYY